MVLTTLLSAWPPSHSFQGHFWSGGVFRSFSRKPSLVCKFRGISLRNKIARARIRAMNESSMSHPGAIIGDVIKYPEMVMARTVQIDSQFL